MEYLPPWYATAEASLVAELKRELCIGHVLMGREVQVLARRQDRDDVLFALCDEPGQVAMVHLTFNRETNPNWPRTEVFASIEGWRPTMEADHAEFES
jgi:hypothetical protein